MGDICFLWKHCYIFYCCCSSTLVAMATWSFHWLTMGKVKIEIYCYLIADILTKFYRNIPGVVLYKPYEFCPNRWFWLVAMATEVLNFRKKKYSEIFFSEVIRRMKLKLCINVFVIILYINCVFYCCCACGFVAMATLSFHRFIMGYVKVGLYFYLTLGILTKALQ